MEQGDHVERHKIPRRRVPDRILPGCQGIQQKRCQKINPELALQFYHVKSNILTRKGGYLERGFVNIFQKIPFAFLGSKDAADLQYNCGTLRIFFSKPLLQVVVLLVEIGPHYKINKKTIQINVS